ncbi:MAG TPA: hypothetical protein VFB06_15050 [Streptosporangiaceae bacterium]|nr:hypothetical protein [Streptosporangiaceae bacterium]
MTEVFFTADPDGLDALNRRVAVIEDGMRGLTVGIERYSQGDLSPTGNVWTSLYKFSESWSEALGVINTNIGALQQRLARASTLYRAADQGISDAARQDVAALRQDGARG